MAAHRLLCLICQRAHDEGLTLKGELSAVLRKITEEDRRKIYQIAKKFVQGMTAGQPHHGFDYAYFFFVAALTVELKLELLLHML